MTVDVKQLTKEARKRSAKARKFMNERGWKELAKKPNHTQLRNRKAIISILANRVAENVMAEYEARKAQKPVNSAIRAIWKAARKLLGGNDG